MKSVLLTSFLMTCAFFCHSAEAHWTLVEQESSVNFVSTKNQHISEVQHFRKLQGQFAHQGNLQLKIDLSSIDSGIEIRDTRMRENLFLVNEFSMANLTAHLPESVLKQAIGSSMLVTLPATLSLMGKSKTIEVKVQVSRKLDNSIVATSTQPILISAADFDLVNGIEVLQALAGLDSIGLTVPVSFNLIFNKQ